MFKFRWLTPLFEAEGAIGAESGVENVPAAGEQSQRTEVNADPSGVETKGAADPEQQNNFEKAFAKRLSAKEAEIEAKFAEKYKGYDDYKLAAEYLQKTSGIGDILTLREQIELQQLQERAEEANVPPEVLKRIDQLEAKAAKADEMEAEAKQKEEWQSFETSLKDFCKDKTLDGKAVDHMDLWKYMHENEVTKPDVAFKAMKADLLESKLETAKTDAVKEYLATKTGVKTEGSQGAAAQSAPVPTGGFKGAEQRAVERMRAAREAQ